MDNRQSIEQYLDSREVAELVGKDHRFLLRDIRRYITQFNQCNIDLVDFFRESTYKDGKGELRPCYQITMKGCEFIAHKLTGQKGTEFTARYINRFHEMQEHLENESGREEIRGLEKMIRQQGEMIKSIQKQMVSNRYLPARREHAIQEQYRNEIINLIETNNDEEYLCGVYSFASHYIIN